MGNLVWTGILYTMTASIVMVCYRAFMADRKAERERGTRALIEKAYQKVPAAVDATIDAKARAPAGPKLAVPPPWAAKNQAPPPPWLAKSRRA